MRPTSFLLSRFYPRHPAMKIRSATVSAVLAGSAALLPQHAQSWTAPAFMREAKRMHKFPFSSTSVAPLGVGLAAEEEVVPALPPPVGNHIAEGTIVSRFHGGLIAVRIDEELEDPGQIKTQVDPASAPAGNSKSQGGSVSGDLMGKQIVFADGSSGVVVVHRPPVAFVYSDSDVSAASGIVKVFKNMASICIPEEDKIVDCFGRSQGESVQSEKSRAIFAPIPQVKDIALINSPMLTGVTMIDTLSPIGQGQNMLMVGSDIEQMRGYTMSLLKTQLSSEKKTKCIYAATEQREEIIKRLSNEGIADDVHVVVPSSEYIDKDTVSRAAEAATIAGTACAIGESYALEEGMNSLIVVDTIDQHKTLWDATTRVLVDLFGVDAVVAGDRSGAASSEMRAFYSSLIQRSSQYKKNRGGGSVTILMLTKIPSMDSDEDTVYLDSDFEGGSDKVKERIGLLVKRKIPLTAANLRKIDIPVPSSSEGQRRTVLQHVDDLHSMTDGLIWLDERLENQCQPPMDPQRSVTRIGIGADTVSRADAPALRRVAEGLRLTLSQAASMEGAEQTSASKKQLSRQQALLLAMYQEAGAGERRLSDSCVALLAASEGLLDDALADGVRAGAQAGVALMNDLLQFVRTEAPECVTEIDASFDCTNEVRSKLSDVIKSFFTRGEV